MSSFLLLLLLSLLFLLLVMVTMMMMIAMVMVAATVDVVMVEVVVVVVVVEVCEIVPRYLPVTLPSLLSRPPTDSPSPFILGWWWLASVQPQGKQDNPMAVCNTVRPLRPVNTIVFSH